MTYWVRQHWTNVDRRYHSEKDCPALTRAKGNPKEATESEVEAWSLCKFCKGTVNHADNHNDLHHRLRKMDPDEVSAETAGGQS